MKVIELQGIWKKYRVHYEKRILIKEAFSNLLGRSKYYDEFWALKNISLEIKRGQTIGIIGKNGSGKTTLLRLLCGVTKATKGSIKVNAQVAGLLDLGAGFQNNLTGKENIYLNGLILGLSRKEIQRDIDAIIDFADIGDFINVPVRTYSAGMYVRLGFAITTQLNPDILLIDEGLAVGDLAFQEKCLNKIKEFKRQGRTIVFVSHNLNIVRQLCERVILMDKGSIVGDGGPGGIINRYLSFTDKRKVGVPTKEIEITNAYFKNDKGEIVNTFKTGEEMRIIIEYSAHKKIENPVFGIGIYRDGVYLVGPNIRDDKYKINYVENRGIVVYKIESIPFIKGKYKVSLSIHDVEEKYFYDYCEQAFEFSVIPGQKDIKYGLFAIEGEWAQLNIR